jgi:hypothetical protein
MKYAELYKKIGDDLAARLKSIDAISKDDYNDILADDDFKIAYGDVDIKPSSFDCVVDLLKNFDESRINDDVVPLQHFYIGSVANDNESLFKDLCVYSKTDDLLIITANKLFDFAKDKSDDSVKKAIELIWETIFDKADLLDKFYKYFEVQAKDDCIIVSNEIFNDKTWWNVYSYAYMRVVNEKFIGQSDKIDFDAEQKYSNDFKFSKNNIYAQYFETYHLIAESHVVTNILQRFLVMYQILENLCYRKHLVKIVNSTNKAAIRKIIAYSSRASDKESTEIPNGIRELIAPVSFEDVDFSKYNKFLNKEYSIDINNGKDKNIPNIIYSIRNSIVHNKATELHFSSGNIEEYKDIIPLMKIIIDRIEPQIISLINNRSSNNPIKFKSKTIKLY